MKTAYFDCFSGASGDMILGALIDVGLDPQYLNEVIFSLGLDCKIISSKVLKKGLSGTFVQIRSKEADCNRCLSDIKKIIAKSFLPDNVKKKSIAIFERLARAEAKVHKTDIEKIHFHEVGAIDSIADVVCSVAGLDFMGIANIISSPLNLGRGFVKCAHGILPVPGPAVMELVKGVPVYSSDIEGELVTPTGAAILTTLSGSFGPLPPMIPFASGYGAGTADRKLPNLLRIIIGKADKEHGPEYDEVIHIQANIDDMNPQIYGYIMEKALKMGALDCFVIPAQMKKNRPATVLNILCKPCDLEAFSDFLLTETTTIGLRWQPAKRIKAKRIVKTIETGYGKARVKLSFTKGKLVNISPEYDDCRKIAAQKEIPLKKVMDEVRKIACGNEVKNES